MPREAGALAVQLCSSAIKIIRGELQAAQRERESARGVKQCNRGLWPPALGINNTRREEKLVVAWARCKAIKMHVC